MNWRRCRFFIAAALVSWPASLFAATGDCDHPQVIRFDQGDDSASVSGGVVRAESLCYALDAKAGQTLKLKLTSPDDNVVITVYQPGYKVTGSSNDPDFAGKTLPGAADEDEAMQVTASLPADGRYLFVLGTTRGAGGEFHMQVSVR